jgi:hypothetical protein
MQTSSTAHEPSVVAVTLDADVGEAMKWVPPPVWSSGWKRIIKRFVLSFFVSLDLPFFAFLASAESSAS